MIVEAEMILIKNARVMDPESGFDQVTDILLDGKRIRQIGKVDDVSGIEQVIDASGMIAAPGLIDVHVHFRDPGFTYKEDLHTGALAAAKGGFTSVICGSSWWIYDGSMYGKYKAYCGFCGYLQRDRRQM